MIGPRAKGGLGMPDFDITNYALRSTWIKRLVSSYPTASWTHIPVTLLEQVSGLYSLAVYKFFYSVLLRRNTWWSIWSNRFIRIGDHSVYYKEWHEEGVKKIRDLFRGNTFLSYRDICSHLGLKTNFLPTTAYVKQFHLIGLKFWKVNYSRLRINPQARIEFPKTLL